MKTQNVGYVRVSSVDQNTERQLEGIELDRKFTDTCSGKDTKRPALQECLKFIRDGDTLYVHSIDRLARNMQDLLALVSALTERGVSVIFLKNNLTFKGGEADPTSALLLNMLGAVAQFERDMIRERQREGIAIARKAGKYTGRKAALTPSQAAEARRMVAEGRSKAEVAATFNISRQTLYRLLKNETA